MAPNFLCELTNACSEGKNPVDKKLLISVCKIYIREKERNPFTISDCVKLLTILRLSLCCCRKPECDIRIQLPNVSLEHAVVRVDKEKKVS